MAIEWLRIWAPEEPRQFEGSHPRWERRRSQREKAFPLIVGKPRQFPTDRWTKFLDADGQSVISGCPN